MPGAVDLSADVIVGGRYRLLESLASGSTASVWRARDTDTDREVAVKVLRDGGVDPVLRARAAREASILTGISHPNLVEVLDSGVEDDRPFLVMALLEGEPLQRIISTRGRVPVDESVALIADIAEGLGVAHDKGVVHRDVKPSNIVCHEQVPTLVDFGIARAIDATTLTRGLVVGTASYLAPEQAQGMAVTPAADVYALACVLYELITGTPPFTGDSPVTVALRHVQDDPVPPADRVAVPAAVNAVVMTALAKDPSRRPPDAHAFSIALRRALDGGDTDQTIVLSPAGVTDGTTVMPALAPATAPAAPAPAPAPAPSRAVAIALAAGATIVFLALLLWPFGGDSGAEAQAVPIVAGATVSQATKYLDAAGFEVDITNVASDRPAGVVLGSDPPAGTKLRRGDTITLSVAEARPTTVPPTIPPAPRHGRGGGKRRDD